MDLQTFRTLLSDTGQSAIESAQNLNPSEADFLTHFSNLSRQYPPELARAALETAILRLEGESKFPQAAGLYFTRQALEQSTSWRIAQYRAERYQGLSHVFDLGCSIGADTLALAEKTPTTGVDLDSLRLAMAQANLDALGLQAQANFIQADLNAPLPFRLDKSHGLFFDPARRQGARRSFSVHDYQPALPVIQKWLPDCPNLGVKISPGVQLEEILQYPAEVEFISLSGELKEAVLWFGALKTTTRRATILPGPYTLVLPPGFEDTVPPVPGSQTVMRQALSLSEPLAYLIEPDPAVLRAGLIQAYGAWIGAAQLDEEIAYLTSDQPVLPPFARSWKIEAWLPFNLKKLRSYLRERKVGRVTVKKRGSPLQPEQLIHLLRLSFNDENRAERVLVLTHLRGEPIVVVCYPNL